MQNSPCVYTSDAFQGENNNFEKSRRQQIITQHAPNSPHVYTSDAFQDGFSVGMPWHIVDK